MNFQPIRGSGGDSPGYNQAPSGGGGKWSSQGVTANNTLRSNSFARIVELLSEGPIQGLVNGGTSVYFNQTPVVNADGTVNYRGVQWEERTGLPDQTPMLGNATSSTQTSVGIQVQFNYPPPVVTIEDVNATSAHVVVSIPALYAQDNNGNVSPTSVSWNVQVQPSGGAYEIVDTVNISNQKCVSVYQHQSNFTLPAGGSPWNIKVVRLTADSDTTNLANATYFDNYTTIVAGNFTYPNSAVIGLTVDAALFQSGSIPARSFHVQGLIIQVPSNYDPTTRLYSGVWDGTFKSAYTNNPAWILYDILINSRYGIGDFIDASKVDKWGLYAISQYCDQLIPNGFGSTEPRYVFNGVLNSRQDAWKAIQSITSCFRGMTYWATGQVFATIDMPADASKLVTPANVIDGHFQYSGTGLKTRHSVAMVRWNDPLAFYASSVEVVVSDQQLLQYGWRETHLTAVGCTSRGQANRMGRWLLDTEQYSTETVEYSCAWDHVDVRPGEIIAIADPNKNGVRLGGRLAGVESASQITMDQAFPFLGGQTYNLMVAYPDGTVGSQPVASWDSTEKIVTLSSPLAQTPIVGAMFVITASDVNPREYRVTNISEEKGIHKVTALFYDPTKYARVELEKPLAVIPYSLPRTTINPPSNFKINETVYTQNGVAQNRLTLSWTPSDDFMATNYLISGQSPAGGSVQTIGSTNASSYDIDNPALGEWTFYIQSVGATGLVSAFINATFNVQGWAAMPPPYVSHLEIYGNATDDDFTGSDCHMTWVNNFPGSTTDVGQETIVGAGNASPFYRDNVITIIDTNTLQQLRQEIVASDDYIYTYGKNVADNALFSRGPQREFTVEVAVQDTLGRESANDSLVVVNPPPPVMFPTVATASGQIYISWVNPADPDYVGCVVWVSENPAFDPGATTPVYQGPNNFFTYPGIINDTYYVRIGGYDSFGTAGINVSPPVEVICAGFAPDTTPPAVPTNLALTPGYMTMPTGEVVQDLAANWDASPSTNFAYFEVAIELLGGSYITNQTSLNGYVWSSGIVAVQTYLVRVRAWSKSGYQSDWCTPVQITMPAKTTAPGVPTGFAVSASLKAAYLTWANPSDPDLDHIEITQSLDTTLTDGSVIGSSYGTGFTVSGLTTLQPYNYWIRAFNTSGVASAYVGPVAVTPGVVANGDIAAGTITGDRIYAGSITGDRINVSTSLPATITVGSSGVQIGSLSDPAQFINANTTLIGSGKIQLSGGTTLSSWQSGSDITKINGGAISANTITANSLSIGNRGVQFSGFAFNYNGTTQLLSWSTGYISYINDAGTSGTLYIAAGSVTYAGSQIYVSWVKDATSLSSGTTLPTSINTIVVATLSAGSGLVVTYGGTQIDGSNISTGTIQTAQLAAGSVTANTIGAGQITANNIAAGTITGNKIAANTITANNITAGAITAQSLSIPALDGSGNIAAGAVGMAQLNSSVSLTPGVGSITGTMIQNGAISTAQLAANSIVGGKIQAGSIGAVKLSVGILSAITADLGTINAGQINSSTMAADGTTPVMQINLNSGYILFSS